MELEDLMAARFSVRHYADRPIEDDKLQHIIEAGTTLAPTGANRQPQRIYVLKSTEAIAKIRGLVRCAFDAPVVLMVTYSTDEEWKNPFDASIAAGAQDASIAGTHMMLEAWKLGIGSCWVNLFDVAEVHEAFGLPAEETLLFLMPLGYAAEGAKPSHLHSESRPISEMVEEL